LKHLLFLVEAAVGITLVDGVVAVVAVVVKPNPQL
jgi:hypothetical protein